MTEKPCSNCVLLLGRWWCPTIGVFHEKPPKQVVVAACESKRAGVNPQTYKDLKKKWYPKPEKEELKSGQDSKEDGYRK